MKRMVNLLLALCLLGSLALPASAAGTVTYVGGADKFLFAPGSQYSPTDLFDGMKNIMPGDTRTQEILVQNKLANMTNVRIYVRAKSTAETVPGFLSQLQLKVTDKHGVIFEGSAAQTSGWVSLGSFYMGSKSTLTLTLEVPVELDNRYQNAIGNIEWEFLAEEIPITNPKTEDTFNLIFWATLLTFSTAALFLLLVRKRRTR